MHEAELKLEDGALRGETFVAAPPPQVLAYVAELRNMERWWPEHWRYRRLSGDGGPGTHYLWLYVAMGVALPGLTRIEAREPGHLAYRTAMAGLPLRMDYEFLPAQGGTLVRVQVRSAGLRLGLFARKLGQQLGQALGRLAQSAM